MSTSSWGTGTAGTPPSLIHIVIVTLSLSFRLFVQAKDDGSLLRPEVFSEIKELDDLVHSIEIEWDEDKYTYASLCANWEGECYENDVIELNDTMTDIAKGTTHLTWPVFLTPESFKSLAFPFIFGGIKVGNLSRIEFVKALQLNYFLAVDSSKQDARYVNSWLMPSLYNLHFCKLYNYYNSSLYSQMYIRIVVEF